MAGYIQVPIETNPETLAQDIFDYIQTQEPGWTPADGNLDVWIIRAVAAKAAENRTLASDVPDTIFATMGATLFAVPPIDDVAATGNTTWTLIDTVGHTIPAGTTIGFRNTTNDLILFDTVSDVIIAPGDSVTAAGEVAIRAVDPGTGGNVLSGTVSLITTLDWVSSIAIVGTTGGGIDAETNDVYLNRLSEELQELSTVPILPADFARAAKKADPGVFRALAIDMYLPLNNMLTANEADIETDATGWAALANCTVTQSATFADNGTKSLRLSSTAGGNMSAILVREVPVIPGETYTAIARERGASVRTCSVNIRWIDASHVFISDATGVGAVDATGAFTSYTAFGIAPSNAAYAKVWFSVLATGGASELHYVDKASLRHGGSTDWVQGGTLIDPPKTVAVAAIDVDGNNVSTPIKNAIIAYINSKRETNWVTYAMDPNVTSIDVATNIKVLIGYDPTATETAVESALTDYLSKKNWGLDPAATKNRASTWVDQQTVYINELIQLVSNVTGVDRVADLTVNITGHTPARIDVPIPGPAALTTVGTIAATAV